jgi:multisubunit Na+/H+ antiporter MnhF subunit
MTMTMTRTIINHRTSTEVVRSDGTSLNIIGIVVVVGVALITREIVEVSNASVITVGSDIGNVRGSGRGF